MTYGSKCNCKQSSKLANFADPSVLRKTAESQSDLVGVNIIALSSLVAALPDGGKGLLRKTVSLVSDGNNNNEDVKPEFPDVSKSQPSPKPEAPTQLPSGVEASKNVVQSPSKDLSSALLHSDYAGSKDNDRFFPSSSSSMEFTKQEPRPSGERQAFDVVSRLGSTYYIDLSNDSPEKAQSTLQISPSPRSMSISPEQEVISTPLPSGNHVQVDGFARSDESEDPPTHQSSPAKSSDMDLDSSCDSPGSTPKKVRESVFKKSFKLSCGSHTSPLAPTDHDQRRPLGIPKPHVPPAPEKYSPLSLTETLIKQGNIARNTYPTPIKSPSIKVVSPVSNKPTTEKSIVVLDDSCTIVPTPSSLTLSKSSVVDSGGPGVNVAFGLEGSGCGGRMVKEAPPCKALFDRNSPRCDTDFSTDVRRSHPLLLRPRSPHFFSESPPPKRPVPDLSTIGHTPVGDLQGTNSVPPMQDLEGCTAPLPCSDAVFPPSYVPTPPGTSRLLTHGRSLSGGNGLNQSPSWKDREMIMAPPTSNALLMTPMPAVQSTPESSTDKPLGFADIDARVLPPAFNDSVGTPTKDEPDRSKLENLMNPTQIQDLGCRVPPFGSISSTSSPLAPKSTALKDFDARSDRQDFRAPLRSPHRLSVSSDGAILPPPVLCDFSKPPPLPSVDIGCPDFRVPPPSHVTIGSHMPSPTQNKVQSPRPVVPPTPGSTSDPQYGDTKREEEEGEIVDDDEDPGEYGAEDSVESIDMDLGDRSFGDADNESLTSYSLSPSPVKQGKRFYLPPRKNTKKYYDHRRAREKEKLLQPYDPSCVDRVRKSERARRSSHRSSEPFPEPDFDGLRYSPSGFQPGYRDMDYRFPAQTHASSFEGSTDTDFSENGDRDYRVPRDPGSLSYSATSAGAQGRYQVYVPKSAEAVSMPVKVINHAHVDNQLALTDRSRRNSIESRNFRHDMAFSSPIQPQKPVSLLADPTLSPPHSNSSDFSPHHQKEASQVVPRLRCSVTVPLMGEPPISSPRFLPPSILPINPVSVAIGRPGLYIQSPPLIGIPGLPPAPPLTALNQAALLPYYASILNCPNPSWGYSRK